MTGYCFTGFCIINSMSQVRVAFIVAVQKHAVIQKLRPDTPIGDNLLRGQQGTHAHQREGRCLAVVTLQGESEIVRQADVSNATISSSVAPGLKNGCWIWGSVCKCASILSHWLVTASIGITCKCLHARYNLQERTWCTRRVGFTESVSVGITQY